MALSRADAIAWYQAITGGEGVDRNSVLDVLERGALAEKHWNDALFTYGIEYGVLIALISVFDLTNEEVHS